MTFRSGIGRDRVRGDHSASDLIAVLAEQLRPQALAPGVAAPAVAVGVEVTWTQRTF